MQKQHRYQVFQCLRDAGLMLRGRKCHIGLSEVLYLGHVFSAFGISPGPKKIKAVQDWPLPTDVTAIHQFLGLASYYRQYILSFAEIVIPLHNLTQKNVPFSRSSYCKHAFRQLKSQVSAGPSAGDLTTRSSCLSYSAMQVPWD